MNCFQPQWVLACVALLISSAVVYAGEGAQAEASAGVARVASSPGLVEGVPAEQSQGTGGPEAQAPGTPAGLRAIAFASDADVSQGCGLEGWQGGIDRCVDRVKPWNPWEIPPEFLEENYPRSQLPQTMAALSRLSFLLMQDLAARWTASPESARMSIEGGLKEFGVYRLPLLSSTFSRWSSTTVKFPVAPSEAPDVKAVDVQAVRKSLRGSISIPSPERWLDRPLCPALSFGTQEGLSASTFSPEVSGVTVCTDSFSRYFKLPGQDRYRQGQVFGMSRTTLEGPFLDQLYPVHLSGIPPWYTPTLWLPMRPTLETRTPDEVHADMTSAYGLMHDAYTDTVDQLLRALLRYGPSTWSSVQLRTLGSIAAMFAIAPSAGDDQSGRAENSGDLGNTDPAKRSEALPRGDTDLHDETDPEWGFALASLTYVQSQRELLAWLNPETLKLPMPPDLARTLLAEESQLWFSMLEPIRQTLEDGHFERLKAYPLGHALTRTVLCHARYQGDDVATRRERCLAPTEGLPVGLARRFRTLPLRAAVPVDDVLAAPGLVELLPTTFQLSDWEPLLIRLDRDERDGLRTRMYGLILGQLVARARVLELKGQLREMVLPGIEAEADFSLPPPPKRLGRQTVAAQPPPFTQQEVTERVFRLLHAWDWIWAEQLPEDFSQLPDPRTGRQLLEILALQMLDWMSVQKAMRTPGDLPLWAVQSTPATDAAILAWENLYQKRLDPKRSGRPLPPESPEESLARAAAWRQLYREINPSRSSLPEFWPRSLHPEEVARLGLARSGSDLTLYREQLYRAVVPAIAAHVLNALAPGWEGLPADHAKRLERRARHFIVEGLSTGLWSVGWNVSFPTLALQEARQKLTPFLDLLLDDPRQLPLAKLAACRPLRDGDVSLLSRWNCQADHFLSQRILTDLVKPEYERLLSTRLLEALVGTLSGTGQRTYRRWLFQQRTLQSLAGVVQGQRQWSPSVLQDGIEEGWKELLFAHGLRGRRDEPPQRPSVNPLAVCSSPALEPEGRLSERSIRPITLDVLFDGPSGVSPAEALWEARGRLPFIAVDGSSAAFGDRLERILDPPKVFPVFRMPIRAQEAVSREAPEIIARGPSSHRRTLYLARWRLWSGWHTFWNIQTTLESRFPILHTGALCADTLLIEAGLEATLWRWALLKDASPTNPMLVGQDYSQEVEDELLERMELRRLETLASEGQTGEEGTVEATRRHLEDQALFGAEEGRDLAARTSQGYAALTPLQQQLQRRLRTRLAEVFQTQPQPLKPGTSGVPTLLLVMDQVPRRKCRPIAEEGPQFYLRHSAYLRQKVSFYPQDNPCQLELAGWGWAVPFKDTLPLYVHVTPDYEPPLNPLLPPSQLLWRPRAHQEVSVLVSVGRSGRQVRGAETSLQTGDPDTVGWVPSSADYQHLALPTQLELASLVTRWSSERTRMGLELGALTRLELLTQEMRVETDPLGQLTLETVQMTPMIKAGAGLTGGIRFAPVPGVARSKLSLLPAWGVPTGSRSLPLSLRREWGIRGRTLAAFSYGEVETSVGIEAWQTFSIRRNRGLLQSFTPYAPRTLLGLYVGLDYAWYPLAEPPESASFYPTIDRVVTMSLGLRGQLNLTNLKPPPLPGGN